MSYSTNHAEHLETATFSMGCFWGPEALFGSLPGVVRTRTGYAGGTTENPTYWTLEDHIETVQLDFDPAQISYTDLLDVFFANHTPTREPRKRQYASALFYHSPEQETAIHAAIAQQENLLHQPLQTIVYPYQHFYLAEERHQKWKLRRHPELWDEFQALFPDFQQLNNSPAVAKVNGYLSRYVTWEQLEKEIHLLGLSKGGQELLQQLMKQPRPIGCRI